MLRFLGRSMHFVSIQIRGESTEEYSVYYAKKKVQNNIQF